MKKRQVLALGIAAVVISLCLGASVPGCSSNTIVPIKEPDNCKFQEITMAVMASNDINRARNGEARPVQVRLYQLASEISLQNASFDQVWKKDAETLGEDIVKVEEFPAYPDSRTEVKFERDDKAQYVAAVALFRQPRGRSWYTVFELPPAPSEGNCAAQCVGDDCDGGAPQSVQLYVWIDESRVEDGADHADFVPTGRTTKRKSTAKKPEAPPEGAPAK